MKKITLFIAAVVLANIVSGLVSCSTDKPADKTVYTVTFDADGGVPVPEAQKVEADETAIAPATNPAKSGYVFLFWRLSGAGTAYNFQTPVNNDITLAAKWEEEASVEYWQVTWELNGGTWPADDNHATQVAKGGTLPEPKAPVKEGGTFDGWYKEAALSTKINFPYDVSSVMGHLTLYAKWQNETVVSGYQQMVASGEYHNFVLKADGTLHATGRNKYGQLGIGNQTDADNLTQVTTGITAVYTGGNTTFIMKSDGSVYGTGLNDYGQLGVGDETDRTGFTAINMYLMIIYP